LENTVGAVEGAVEIGVDDEIIAPDIPRCAGARLDEHTSLLRDE
jgi:hypothetical protein